MTEVSVSTMQKVVENEESLKRRATLRNCVVLGSRWESDLISILSTGYWYEFEIKTTLADFKNDFRKRFSPYHGLYKHEVYSGSEPVENPRKRDKRLLPVPRRFFFVVPELLVPKVEIHVPKHAGLISISGDRLFLSPGDVIKDAPLLKAAVKLDVKQLHNIAEKLSRKLRAIRSSH